MRGDWALIFSSALDTPFLPLGLTDKLFTTQKALFSQSL
jgi:hypothetical protein